MTDLKAYLLYYFADQSGPYACWPEHASLPTVVVDDFLPDWSVPADAGILITHMHYRWEEISFLRRIHQQNRIPILILCDGILEYRNTWQHPELPNGSLFQPACGHKIACLGRAPARTLETWGNVGRCEFVGLPRLDATIASDPPPIQTTGPFRLLIATANTPAFDAEQRETVVESLRLLQQKLQQTPTVNDRPIEVHWRLSDGLAEELGIESVDPDAVTPLTEAIDGVDAVITTPSTIYLESVLRNRPTALLDFHNCPCYIPAAWVIAAQRHLDVVLAELANPPAAKMLFQSSTLQDQLECQSPATPRMIALIDAMVAERRRSMETLQPLNFPARILDDPQHGFSRVPAAFNLASLFPADFSFQHLEIQRLQIELAAAVKRMESLPMELAEKNQMILRLHKTADRTRMRNQEMHHRIGLLRARLGLNPSRPDNPGDPQD